MRAALGVVRYRSAMRWAWLMVVTSAVTACVAVPTASPSTAQPSASAPAQAGLPPGCENIDLRSPAGDRVDLTGAWAGSGILAGESEAATWLQQVGDCVYGSVVGSGMLGAPLAGTITNLSGRVGPDFEIDFEVVIVSQPQVVPFGTYSTMVVRIEWDDDGRIRLREDRDPGETASRCPQAALSCPAPVIWYRVDEPPVPS